MMAAEIAYQLGGRKSGTRWMARCPAHDDRTPSLSIREAPSGKLLVHCFAGCKQDQVIDALLAQGLWTRCHSYHRQIVPPHQIQHGREGQLSGADRERDDAARTARALSIWRLARPIVGTIAEEYLRRRGIVLDAWPETLRFHLGLDHPSNCVSPALVGLVTKGINNIPVGIHRTFLAHDGAAKAAVDPQKMMLGPCGGGAVRLGTVQPDNWLVIGEGIETTLSVMQACGLPGWAALSAAGIRNLILPPEARMVAICADNDANGTGKRAADAAAERFLREGRRVRVAVPRERNSDFNDLLNSNASTQMDKGLCRVG
jgi:hypothetical protein